MHNLFNESPLAYWLSLFPSASRSCPRFMALAEAILRQAADLAALAQSIVPGFSFATAVGGQLDALGASVSIPRQEGWDDETYRGVLLRKLKLWTWDGMNASVPDFLASGETLKDNGDGSVTVTTASLPLPANVCKYSLFYVSGRFALRISLKDS